MTGGTSFSLERALSWVTRARAIWISALLAAVIHFGALNNEWALDDPPIVGDNPKVHSVEAAFAAFFDPYWARDAGQYRPAILVSYAADWAMSGGSPVWLHAVNVVLHAVVTALFVVTVLAWLSPLAALAAGLVFAVHPVHVEAVANVVGRAELAVAALLLGAILTARRYRAARTGGQRTGWLYATLALVLVALLSKEHAIVAVALLALDELAHGRLNVRRHLSLYLSVIVVSASWLLVFTRVAGRFVESSVAATIRDLSFAERMATMVPVQLHVVRLLAWPFELASDYNPNALPRLTEWSWVATIGLVLVGAVVWLSFAMYRKTPALTFGVWLAIITYSPTSNILFSSGIVLAERNLYLAAGAVAIVAGLLVRDVGQVTRQPAIAAALLLVIGAFGARTVQRVPAWENTRSLVIEDYASQSHNYRTRLRLAALLRDSGRPAEAMAEATAAAAIFPEDPFSGLAVVPHILRMGYVTLAAQEAERVHALVPENAGLARMAVRARLGTNQGDSALALSRRSLERWPGDSIAAGSYQEVVDTLQVPQWARSLAAARVGWTERRLADATRTLTAGVASLPGEMSREGCWDVHAAEALVRDLSPDLAPRLRESLAQCGNPAQTAREPGG